MSEYVIIRYYHYLETPRSKQTTMTEEAPPDVKRRRLSAADDPHQDARCLTDLSSGILAHASSFLGAPSRALFAIALDEITPNEERSSAIVGNQDILDFGEIEKDLAKRLTDRNIQDILICTDAVNNVKRLKLTNCVAITGAGLEPLRGSVIIEQIDLSLVGEHQSPVLDPKPSISRDDVLPILDSIISQEGCQLKHMEFSHLWREQEPQLWREQGRPTSAGASLYAFVDRYNQTMRDNGEEISCSECNAQLPCRFSDVWISEHHGWYMHTCYGCLKHYCYICNNNGVRGQMLHHCDACEREYCKGCSEMTSCASCMDYICHDCFTCECHKCNAKICSRSCIFYSDECDECVDCERVVCPECYANDEQYCDRCNQSCCNDCRLQRYRRGQRDCTECMEKIAPLLGQT